MSQSETIDRWLKEGTLLAWPQQSSYGREALPIVIRRHTEDRVWWAYMDGPEYVQDTSIGTFIGGVRVLKRAEESTNFHYWKTRALAAEEALVGIRDELGVPDQNYPAPIANAVEIARGTLAARNGSTE